MRLFFLLFFILVLSTNANAQGIAKTIHSPKEILVELVNSEGFETNKRVIIISAQKKRIIAFGRITELVREDTLPVKPTLMRVEIIEILDNLLIMDGDSVELLSVENFKKLKIPGFMSLTLSGEEKIPSMYKDLAYFGVFTSEGHTLDKGETLISPFQLQYGVTNEFGVKVVNALWLDGYVNAGAKYQVYKTRHVKITTNALGALKVQNRDWIGQFGGVITIPSNSKFQSHLMGTFTFDPQFEDAHATKGLGLFQDSDIRSITEYMTDRWNRVLYGPVYNVELQTFGGTVSHMWIWNTFHTSLGLGTKDFSSLRFGSDSYYFVYDFFWRF